MFMFIKKFLLKKELDQIQDFQRKLEKEIDKYEKSNAADEYFSRVGKDICRYELNNNKPKKWFIDNWTGKAKAAQLLNISSKKFCREERNQSRLWAKAQWEKSGKKMNISGSGYSFKYQA